MIYDVSFFDIANCEVWFSYWHYTIIAVSIAIVSGFFNASVRLASQRSIKSMMDAAWVGPRDAHLGDMRSPTIPMSGNSIAQESDGGWLLVVISYCMVDQWLQEYASR